MRYIEVITDDKTSALPVIEDYFDRKQILITSFDCTTVDPNENNDEETRFCCRYFLRVPKGIPFNVVMRDLAKMEEIREVYESNASSASLKKTSKPQI